MKIYLDVCCLNRPFDDLRQDRVRLEAEAVLTILDHCRRGAWRLIGSSVILYEISRNPDAARRERIASLASIAGALVIVDAGVEHRAGELERHGIGQYDAVHLACAEKAGVKVFLTTDDDLERKAGRKGFCRARISNPLEWLVEVMKA